jgi:hypothetical protein
VLSLYISGDPYIQWFGFTFLYVYGNSRVQLFFPEEVDVCLIDFVPRYILSDFTRSDFRGRAELLGPGCTVAVVGVCNGDIRHKLYPLPMFGKETRDTQCWS